MFLDKIQQGSKVSPRQGGKVGFGVVLGFEQRDDLDKLYVVMSDFGNVFKFTTSEFLELYTNEPYYSEFGDNSYAIDNLHERLSTQLLNIETVLNDYLNGKFE